MSFYLSPQPDRPVAAMGRTIIAGATYSTKPVNEDAFAFAADPGAGMAALVVADGIGSHRGADWGSRHACEAFLAAAGANLDGMPSPNLRQMLLGVQRTLHENPPAVTDAFTAGSGHGTTLVSAVQADDRLHLGYLGNGGAWIIRSDFNDFPSSASTPWTAINLLSPHSRCQDGREVLHKFVSPWRAEPLEPTVMTLSLDETVGDIVVLCTDGIYSADQVTHGRDDAGRSWFAAEETMARLFRTLSDFFDAGDYTDVALHAALDRYLHALADADLLDDDATLVVLVTPTALRYQASRRLRLPTTVTP